MSCDQLGVLLVRILYFMPTVLQSLFTIGRGFFSRFDVFPILRMTDFITSVERFISVTLNPFLNTDMFPVPLVHRSVSEQ